MSELLQSELLKQLGYEYLDAKGEMYAILRIMVVAEAFEWRG